MPLDSGERRCYCSKDTETQYHQQGLLMDFPTEAAPLPCGLLPAPVRNAPRYPSSQGVPSHVQANFPNRFYVD